MAKRYPTRVNVHVGETVKVTMPYSEVCAHMKIAGKEMDVKLQSPWEAQVIDADGNPFSFPIAPGEAGLYNDDNGFYTYK